MAFRTHDANPFEVYQGFVSHVESEEEVYYHGTTISKAQRIHNILATHNANVVERWSTHQETQS